MKSEKLEYCKLDELGRISRGRSQHRPRNAPYLYGGSIPFIQTADITRSNLYITEYTQTYTQLGLDQSRLWKQGVLCIVNAGVNTGDTAILNFDACFPDSIIGFIADSNKCNVKFIKYYLDSIKQQIRSITMGATQDNLSVAKLLTFPIPKITLESQNKIAAVISAYDDLIENNKLRIELLENMSEEIYREWFVRFRFPGWETAEFEKGIPKGWKEVALIELGTYLNGFAFKPEHWGIEGKPIIKIKEMTSGVTSNTPRNTGENINQRYFFSDGDIIFSWSATLLVKIWNQGTGLLNQHLFKVTPHKRIPRDFLYFSIKFSLPIFESLTTGSTMKHIKRKELSMVKIALPTQDLLDQFHKTVSPILERSLKLSKQNTALVECKNLLLPRLISGKLSVEELDIQFPPSMQQDATV